QPVYVLGEVRKPGAYAAQPGADLVNFVSQSNGFTEAADLDRIEIIRATGSGKRVYDISWDQLRDAPAPLPGDVVMIHANKQSKSERRFQLWAVMASLLASLASLAIVARRP